MSVCDGFGFVVGNAFFFFFFYTCILWDKCRKWVGIEGVWGWCERGSIGIVGDLGTEKGMAQCNKLLVRFSLFCHTDAHTRILSI